MFNKYPYTDFQQLNLDWFLKEFKQLYDAWVQFKADTEQEIDDFETAMQNDFADLVDQFDDFKDYVNNYLNTLDFPGAVADVITEMVNDGSFLNLIRPSISSEVATWLGDHVTPVGSAVVVDDSLTIAGAAADSKTVGDRFITDESEYNKYFDDISTHGLNMFNPGHAILNSRLDDTGDVVSDNNFYVSDWIEVEADTDYYIHVGLGSSTYFTTCFYTDNKEFIAGDYQTSTVRKQISTPSTCAFIRIAGNLSAIDGQCVSYITTGTPYRKVLNGRNLNKVQLYCTHLFYDPASGEIKTLDTYIRVIVFETVFEFPSVINIGSGMNYLWWDGNVNRIIGSASLIYDENTYLLGMLNKMNYGMVDIFTYDCKIVAPFPIFTFDPKHNSLTVNVPVASYVVYKNQYATLNGGYTQELTLGATSIIVFDMFNKQFETVSSYSDIGNKPIVAIRRARALQCVTEYYTMLNNMAYKRFACFGDSLTSYDGHEFTWGPWQGEICVGFESYLLNELNLRDVSNAGHSGHTTPEICSFIRSASSSYYASKDYVTIMGGDNDDRLNVSIGTLQPIGSTFDTTTLIGALQSAIEYMLNLKPTLRIVLMSEPMGWTYKSGSFQRVPETIPNAYKTVAEFYGLPFIDLYHNSGINEFNRTTYMCDPAPEDQNLYIYHPNNEGWKLVSKLIVNAFKNIIG